jgi:predicted RNA-binding Zn-ribbon protein involved in translation (DUF1610 family)
MTEPSGNATSTSEPGTETTASKFCTHCSASLKDLPANPKFCPECGKSIVSEPTLAQKLAADLTPEERQKYDKWSAKIEKMDEVAATPTGQIIITFVAVFLGVLVAKWITG